MPQFTNGQKVAGVCLANGFKILQTEEPLVALGQAESMTIVMQPSHGGKTPWVYVCWGEEGYWPESEYFNMATLQSVVLKPEKSARG